MELRRSARVDGSGSTAHILGDKPLRKAVASPPPPAKDTHSSLGAMIAFGFFSCFSFVVIKFFTYISSKFKSKAEKVNLENPEKLRDAFVQDPYSVLHEILDLLDKDPDKAEKILIKLATAWKNTQDQYLPYSHDRNCRKSWIRNFDAIAMKLLLTPKQQAIADKLSNVDELKSEDLYIFGSDERWNEAPKKYKTPQAIESRKIHKGIEATKKDFKQNLWGFCYAKIVESDKFTDLNYLRESHESLEEHDTTFGVFLEALLYNRNPRHLQGEDLYREGVGSFTDILRKVMFDLRDDDGYVIERFPQIKSLIEKVQNILGNKKKYERIREIVSRIIPIFLPSGKSPKSSPNVKQRSPIS